MVIIMIVYLYEIVVVSNNLKELIYFKYVYSPRYYDYLGLFFCSSAYKEHKANNLLIDVCADIHYYA